MQVYCLYSNWLTNFKLEWAAGMSIGLFMGVQNCVAFSISYLRWYTQIQRVHLIDFYWWWIDEKFYWSIVYLIGSLFGFGFFVSFFICSILICFIWDKIFWRKSGNGYSILVDDKGSVSARGDWGFCYLIFFLILWLPIADWLPIFGQIFNWLVAS